MANEMDFIVNVLANNQASGVIARLPVEVQQAVREVDAVLSRGFGNVRGLQEFQQQLNTGTADAAQLTRAIVALDAAVGTALGVSGTFGQNLQRRLEELQERALLLQETLARPVTGRDAALSNSPLVNSATRELNRVLDAASDAAAISGANRGTSSAEVLNRFNVTDKQSFDRELAALKQQKAALAHDSRFIDSNDKTALAENAAQIKALSQDIQLLAASYREAKAAAAELNRAGGAALGGQTVARVRSSADPAHELTRIRAESARAETDALLAQGAPHSQIEGALRREIALNEQLIRQEQQRAREAAKTATEIEKAAAAQRLGATGGPGHVLNSLLHPEGGFGSSFSRGFFGRNEADKPLAEQLGQAAKFSVLYGTAYFALFQFAQALRTGFEGAVQFEQSLVELAFATGRTTGEVRGLADAAAKQAANAGLPAELGPKFVAQAVGVFGLADASKEDQRRALIATEVAAQLARVSGGTTDPSLILTQLGGVARAFDVSLQNLASIGDAATFIGRQSGTAPADLLQAVAQVGELAKGAGFTLEETLAAVSQVKTTTAKPAQTVASNLGQIFSRADQPALEAVLREAGVDTIGTTLKQQIGQLSQKDLSQTQENQISAAFGRGAAGQAILALIHGFDQVDKNAERAGDSTDTLNKAFEELQETVGGRLATFSQTLKLTFVELAQTGVLDAFVGLLLVSTPLVQALNDVLSAFNSLPRALRDTALAIAAIYALGGRNAIAAGNASLLGGLLGAAGGGATTATGGRLARFGAGLGRTAGPAAILAAALGLGEAYGGYKEGAGNLASLDDTLDSRGGKGSLQERLEVVQKELEAQQKQGNLSAGFGFLKSLATRGPFGAGGSSVDKAKELIALRDELLRLREEEVLALSTEGKSRAGVFRHDPGQVAAQAAEVADDYGKRIPDAQARGATSQDILGLQREQLSKLQSIQKDALLGGVSPSESFTQQLAVARKNTFDAFVTRVEQLKELAEATASPEEKQAIEQQVAKLLALANGINASKLPTNFTLAALPGLLAAIRRREQEQNRQLIATQTALTNAKIAILEEQANSFYEIANPAFQTRGDAVTKRIADLRAGLAKYIAGLKETRLNNPSFADTHSPDAVEGPKETAAQIAAARAAANAFPGSRVEEAAAQIRVAAADLDAQKRGTVAYYNALRALRRAQYDYSQVLLDTQHVGRQLTIDLTNPLKVVQEELRTARAKLRSDLAKGAPQDVINQDKLAVQQAQNEAERTKFEQNLAQVQTNYDLGRITTAQYLRYLDSQRDSLLKIANRTYQQQQELNQLDKLIQEVQKSLQGQFNLGDIKLPTVLQVRQQVLGGAGAQVANVQNVRIDISGGDIAVIKSVISQYLGPGAFSNSAISPPKL